MSIAKIIHLIKFEHHLPTMDLYDLDLSLKPYSLYYWIVSYLLNFVDITTANRILVGFTIVGLYLSIGLGLKAIHRDCPTRLILMLPLAYNGAYIMGFLPYNLGQTFFFLGIATYIVSARNNKLLYLGTAIYSSFLVLSVLSHPVPLLFGGVMIFIVLSSYRIPLAHWVALFCGAIPALTIFLLNRETAEFSPKYTTLWEKLVYATRTYFTFLHSEYYLALFFLLGLMVIGMFPLGTWFQSVLNFDWHRVQLLKKQKMAHYSAFFCVALTSLVYLVIPYSPNHHVVFLDFRFEVFLLVTFLALAPINFQWNRLWVCVAVVMINVTLIYQIHKKFDQQIRFVERAAEFVPENSRLLMLNMNFTLPDFKYFPSSFNKRQQIFQAATSVHELNYIHCFRGGASSFVNFSQELKWIPIRFKNRLLYESNIAMAFRPGAILEAKERSNNFNEDYAVVRQGNTPYGSMVIQQLTRRFGSPVHINLPLTNSDPSVAHNRILIFKLKPD